jgi:RHS repeat-associated protein
LTKDPPPNYTLDVSAIPDFSSHFTWQSNGGEDLTLSGNSFIVHRTTGSYRIEAVPNVEGCPTPVLLILTGGENIVIEEDCSITVPPYFTKDPFNLSENDIIFSHFSTHLQSKRSIVIMPGVSLDLGAELSLEVIPESEDTDLQMNFTEVSSYDEYGRLLSETRSYFDEAGRSLQTQSKNITDAVVLANATIYDSYGRAAISTLAAPVLADPSRTCPVDDQDGKGMLFGFKPNFITATNEQSYDYSHFDLENEGSPVAVDAATEGTLGWYYSTSNGNSPESLLHEPLVATTQYPYSRTLFHHDGSGDVKSLSRPGDAFKAGSAHLGTADMEDVVADDVYLNSGDLCYLSIREREFGLQRPASIESNFLRKILTDGSGNVSVSYFDKAGNAIISLYFGTGNTPITKSYQFYDDAGRLLVTVSPNGVNQYTVDQSGNSNFADIDKTRYFYNSKGLLSAVEEKVAGSAAAVNNISRTEYIYRKDGSIRFSQNQEQRNADPQGYSYTNYDKVGRPIESGEYVTAAGSIAFGSVQMKNVLDSTNIDGGIVDGQYAEGSGIKKERMFTFYDEPFSNLPTGRVQRFLNGAVSYTRKDTAITTIYSYDERGRVEWIIQDIKDFGIKTIDYRYGPTGQVQEVVYQKDAANERFTHFYEYDHDARLQKVYTTTALLAYDKLGKVTNSDVTYNLRGEIENPGVLQHQASYFYYLHGPLKRIELATRTEGGNTKTLQGIDYVYTIDGALKSINHADVLKDPGGDGTNRPDVRTDVFGMTLDYYGNDYVAAKNGAESITINGADDQYTGLIKAMRWHSPIIPDKQFGYAYTYDQRNQFSEAKWGKVNAGVFTADVLQPYHESIGGYDANGNISSLERNTNVLNTALEYPSYDLTYNYKANTNMLQGITQTKGQNTETFRSYEYDDLGQMTKETQGDKSKFVEYDVSGKVTGVYADLNHTQPIVKFLYDDRGFRMAKTTFNEIYQPAMYTWYVRDASGSVMSTYEKVVGVDTTFRAVEMPVYGSGRIGLYKPVYGHTLYELSDHLGNVRAVIGVEVETEYLATMETERTVKENEDFEKVISAVTSEDINHTLSQDTVDSEIFVIETPNEVLRMNNRPMGNLNPDPIGTGIMLPVHPGDVINAEVFVKYANFNATDNNLVGGLSNFLYTAFQNTAAAVDFPALFNVIETPAVTGLSVWSKLDDEQPQAFLNYLLFDNDLMLQENGFDFDQVTSAAEITGVPSLHERLSLDNITIKKEGFIYVYVSNLSDQNMDVYFDDLRVKHSYSDIVAGGDFYPFGLAIGDRQINRDFYRHGYQGGFSEKDDETGWNHFELRDYDPVIGRWISTDPASQYFSPYVGMGNNPITSVDPDGAYSIIGALWRSMAYQGQFTSAIVNGKRTYGYVDGMGNKQFGIRRDYTHTYGDPSSYGHPPPPPDINVDVQVYAGFVVKAEVGKGNGKFAVPLGGVQVSADTELGGQAVLIDGQTTYFNYKNDRLDFRIIPLNDIATGDYDPSLRLLFTEYRNYIYFPEVPFPIAQWKIQGDIALNPLTNRYTVGQRAVVETLSLPRGGFGSGFKVEFNAGIRFRARGY